MNLIQVQDVSLYPQTFQVFGRQRPYCPSGIKNFGTRLLLVRDFDKKLWNRA